jgi:flagellar basal-body rod protein FlgG
MRALNIAATGLSAQQTHIDVISNNIANMTTTGYKKQRAEFDDLIYQDLRRTGTSTTAQDTILPVGVQIGLGVQTAAIGRDTQQGALEGTDNALDIAVQGKGYLQIQMPDGTLAYTRDGSFRLSRDGEIVTREGFPLEPLITVPDEATSISINAEGMVEVTLQGEPDPQQIGEIELATFINPAGLQAIGDNLFLESLSSGDPVIGRPGEDSIGTLLQGFLETSNVDSVKELTRLIVAQRAYEMNTNILTAADEMLQALNQSA